jgi:hypothetical protein
LEDKDILLADGKASYWLCCFKHFLNFKFLLLLKTFFWLHQYFKRDSYFHFVSLKVPKRENFSLAFFALIEPIWVCELGTGEKNRIFYRLTPDFDSFWFFAAY